MIELLYKVEDNEIVITTTSTKHNDKVLDNISVITYKVLYHTVTKNKKYMLNGKEVEEEIYKIVNDFINSEMFTDDEKLAIMDELKQINEFDNFVNGVRSIRDALALGTKLINNINMLVNPDRIKAWVDNNITAPPTLQDEYVKGSISFTRAKTYTKSDYLDLIAYYIFIKLISPITISIQRQLKRFNKNKGVLINTCILEAASYYPAYDKIRNYISETCEGISKSDIIDWSITTDNRPEDYEVELLINTNNSILSHPAYNNHPTKHIVTWVASTMGGGLKVNKPIRTKITHKDSEGKPQGLYESYQVTANLALHEMVLLYKP